MKTRIAIFLNDIGPVVLPCNDQKELFGIVSGGSRLEHYARANYAGHIIPIHRSDSAPLSDKDVLDDAILHTDIRDQLHRYSVTAILVPAQRSSRHIVTWAHDNHIELLQVPHTLQRSLENKMQFDALMREWNISTPPRIDMHTLSVKSNEVVVVQKQTGCGGAGTKIVNTKELFRQPTNGAMLIRKYIDGVPYGVSIIIDADKNYFCSALRRQCFIIQKNGSPQLLGLQWIPTSSFSQKSLTAIESMLSRLIAVLCRQSFVGIANIDFMLSKDKTYVLECNPRFSGATPQVFSVKKITSRPHPWRFLLNAYQRKKNIPIHNCTVPQSTYCGSLTYIDVEKKMKVCGDIPVGIFTIQKNVLHPSRQKSSRSFFLLHDLPLNTSTVGKGDTLCYILNDNPLFTNTGQLSSDATALRAACLAAFIPHD